MASSQGQTEEAGRGADCNCQGYGSREDSKYGGNVLPVMRGYVAEGGGQVTGTAWELAWGSALLGLLEFTENWMPSGGCEG